MTPDASSSTYICVLHVNFMHQLSQKCFPAAVIWNGVKKSMTHIQNETDFFDQNILNAIKTGII